MNVLATGLVVASAITGAQAPTTPAENEGLSSSLKRSNQQQNIVIQQGDKKITVGNFFEKGCSWVCSNGVKLIPDNY